MSVESIGAASTGMMGNAFDNLFHNSFNNSFLGEAYRNSQNLNREDCRKNKENNEKFFTSDGKIAFTANDFKSAFEKNTDRGKAYSSLCYLA